MSHYSTKFSLLLVCLCAASANITIAIERMIRKFLWGTGFNHVKWDVVCSPKSEGGLGFRKEDVISEASMIKLAWRLCSSNDGIWATWIKGRYFSNCSLREATQLPRCSVVKRHLQGTRYFT